MPRLRRAMGRPGTAVFPAGWSESHAAVVDRTHPSAVKIGPAGGAPVRNPGTRQMETAAAPPVYVGRATLMQASVDQVATVVEDDVATAVYEVKLPYAASTAAQVGHQVTVTSDPDPALAGQVLTVAAIERGSRRFSRVLLATLNTPA